MYKKILITITAILTVIFSAHCANQNGQDLKNAETLPVLTEPNTQPTISRNGDETALPPNLTALSSNVAESTWPIATPSALPPINNDAVVLAKNAAVKKSFAEIVSSLSDNIKSEKTTLYYPFNGSAETIKCTLLSDPFDGTIDDGIEYEFPWKYTGFKPDEPLMGEPIYYMYFIPIFAWYNFTPCDITDEKPVITMKWYFHPIDGREQYKITVYVSASCVWFDYNDIPFPQRYLAYSNNYSFLVSALNDFMIGYKCNDYGERLTAW